MADRAERKYRAAVGKELELLRRQERRLQKAAERTPPADWKQALESRVPEKAYDGLQKAFFKAFSLIFTKGTGIIDSSLNREAMRADHMVRDYAFQLKADRKTLKNLRKGAGSAKLRDLAVTTAEGLGLGALGIGLPDIAVFTGVLLRGIYETALRYGFEYDTPEERLFILKLMEASLQKGESWAEANGQVDRMLAGAEAGTGALEEQMRKTADAFAVELLLLKFVQGLPVVGILGGAGNPLYYNRVVKYAELKYRKRYLLSLEARLSGEDRSE